MTAEPEASTTGPGTSILSATDVGQRIILGGAQRASALLLSSVLAAAGAVIVLRHLDVAGFGHYGTVMSLVGIVYGLSDLGLTVTGTRELALCDTADQRRALLSQILGLRIVITVLAVAAATAFAGLIGYPANMVIGTAIAGLGVVLQSAQAAMLLPLSVQLRNGALAVNQLVQQFVLLLGFALAAALGGGIVTFCAIQILVGAVLLPMAPLLVGRRAIARPRLSLEHTRRLAKVGLPVAAASVVGVVYVRLLVILMSVLSSRSNQLGYFVTSTRVLELAAGVPFLVIGIVLPVATVAARSEPQRLVYITGRVAQLMLLLGIAAALLLWTLAPTILNLVGGRQYLGGAGVLRVQGFALITMFLGAAWQTALMGMGRLQSLSIALGAGLLVLTVSGVVLIPRFQADGAAWATMAGEVVLCLLLYVGVRQAAPGEWLPPRAASRIVLSALFAGVAGAVISGPAILRSMLVIGLFAGSALLMRTIPSEIADAALVALGRFRSSDAT